MRYTTGPRTRAALAAAGALGATTGSTVHLSTPPGSRPAALGVLAHELAHARRPVGRPRFLLGLPEGAADEDERAARSAGEAVRSTADRAVSAGVVDRLPVGGAGAGGVVDVATQAAKAAVADEVAQARQPVTQYFGAAAQVAAGEARDTAGEAAGPVAETANRAAVTVASGPPGAGVDLDRIAEAIEARVLRQLERRGGRYTGVF
ncbi:DUF4157 domain-containing protein [Amycolatopsis sp. cg9]|uniref:eCIS core domain-containing protein n=1 Tax=Amycolatopsis sp. cg9 TaxID=3238801 RepID=UPI0035248D14